ncbi:CDP-alcohol phosphatidyltransferase family protein [Microbacterium sp. NPDC019599]|uniref:CDP-alcohol phosphatidyltransferase family protein n=1 Tax=Microbacterium sp. NPDC019599 TaxID=3154690 RepID=UPI0033EFEDBE
MGRIFAAASHSVGLTPNQVSLISAGFTFTGIALLALAPASVGLGVLVWLLLAVGYAWDSADGQVARLRGGGSLAGEWLDHILDSGKLVSLHIAVAIGWYRFFDLPDPMWVLVPLGFAIVSTVTFFGMILNDLLRGKRGIPQAAETGGSSPLRSLLGLPMDYGVWCMSFVLWGMHAWFMVVYTLLAIVALVHLCAAVAVWFRKMKALG